MKTTLRMILLLPLFLFVCGPLQAQEITKEQWQQQLRDATMQRDELLQDVAQLEADIAKLKSEDKALAEKIETRKKEVMALLGTTSSKENDYGAFLDRIDRFIYDLSKISVEDLYLRRAELDTARSMVEKARSNDLSYIPENAQRIQSAQNRIDLLSDSLKKILALQKNEQVYVVGTWAKDRDCLWNIANKQQIYANPFYWPKIWQENRTQIKDPDVIHTGQKLRIPAKAPLTALEETSLKSYYHRTADYATANNPISSKKK